MNREGKVIYVSKSGKRVLISVETVNGDVLEYKKGFITLAVPSSKEVGDTIKFVADKIEVQMQPVKDAEGNQVLDATGNALMLPNLVW